MSDGNSAQGLLVIIGFIEVYVRAIVSAVPEIQAPESKPGQA